MDSQSFRQAATLLSGEYSLAILKDLRDGSWHLSSEVAKDLDIHVSTVSRFLQRFAELGLVERRAHDARTFEYRLRGTRLHLDLDLLDDGGPLREAVDFYVSYFQSLFEGIRTLGMPAVEGEMEHRLSTQHQELRAVIFEQMIEGSQGGIDRLRDLMAALHKDLWNLCSQNLGSEPAERVFQSALRYAIDTHPDLAVRCGLARPFGS